MPPGPTGVNSPRPVPVQVLLVGCVVGRPRGRYRSAVSLPAAAQLSAGTSWIQTWTVSAGSCQGVHEGIGDPRDQLALELDAAGALLDGDDRHGLLLKLAAPSGS
ncbi:hypothetical protein GCM10010302_44750 [Streptomyces polychromogenes]|uniref:Uncharacterized protein n=1 Tax=Streptomyces polychromogenes TaxID=67342 RepID=A0ABN0VHP6_9ACTN